MARWHADHMGSFPIGSCLARAQVAPLLIFRSCGGGEGRGRCHRQPAPTAFTPCRGVCPCGSGRDAGAAAAGVVAITVSKRERERGEGERSENWGRRRIQREASGQSREDGFGNQAEVDQCKGEVVTCRRVGLIKKIQVTCIGWLHGEKNLILTVKDIANMLREQRKSRQSRDATGRVGERTIHFIG